MRLYFGGLSRPNLLKARKIAPSHTFGVCWTPSDRRLNQIPFFVDNGAYTSSFDESEWLSLLDSLEGYAYRPDFVVLPDVLGDAEATLERHRQYVDEVRDRGLRYAAVVQPGLEPEVQILLADRLEADWLFVGGSVDWKREVVPDVVARADEFDLPVHVGNPGGADGLTWAHGLGVDSVDTTTVTQNGYWHYLEALEAATESPA